VHPRLSFISFDLSAVPASLWINRNLDTEIHLVEVLALVDRHIFKAVLQSGRLLANSMHGFAQSMDRSKRAVKFIQSRITGSSPGALAPRQ
jgi:hypothetical protein